jgi:hypothetical protein
VERVERRIRDPEDGGERIRGRGRLGVEDKIIGGGGMR